MEIQMNESHLSPDTDPKTQPSLSQPLEVLNTNSQPLSEIEDIEDFSLDDIEIIESKVFA